jgi:hypothetical protein
MGLTGRSDSPVQPRASTSLPEPGRPTRPAPAPKIVRRKDENAVDVAIPADEVILKYLNGYTPT